MDKKKKILYITLGSLDVAATLFLFIISIIMLATMPNGETLSIWKDFGHTPANFIEWFQMNSTAYLLIGVLPLFILLGLNVGIVIHLFKKSKEKKLQLNDLTDEQKEALKKEILKDLDK